MRAREKTLADYGISEEEGKELYERCRNLSENDEDLLFMACMQTCDSAVLASKIYVSLTQGFSYDTMSATEYMPISRDSFYGYRRKTLARFNELLKGEGKNDD